MVISMGIWLMDAVAGLAGPASRTFGAESRASSGSRGMSRRCADAQARQLAVLAGPAHGSLVQAEETCDVGDGQRGLAAGAQVVERHDAVRLLT